MTVRLHLLFCLALTLPAAPAAAQPASVAADRRVQLVDYDPDRVTALRALRGFQLMVEFGADERIENVSIGDSVGWQVTPNRRANILFLKPIDGPATNMTVVTDRRRYLFDLRLAAKGARAPAPYAVRFVYPAAVALAPAPPPETGPRIENAAYAVSGASATRPLRVFDDGEMTYFEWPPQAAAPAIFAVSGDGSESIVNYTVRGRYIVVHQLAPRFILRNGKEVASVINGAFPGQLATRRSR